MLSSSWSNQEANRNFYQVLKIVLYKNAPRNAQKECGLTMPVCVATTSSDLPYVALYVLHLSDNGQPFEPFQKFCAFVHLWFMILFLKWLIFFKLFSTPPLTFIYQESHTGIKNKKKPKTLRGECLLAKINLQHINKVTANIKEWFLKIKSIGHNINITVTNHYWIQLNQLR